MKSHKKDVPLSGTSFFTDRYGKRRRTFRVCHLLFLP